MKLPLFWSPKFSLLNSDQNGILSVLNAHTNSLATMPYRLSGTRLRSPGIGTFGGLFCESEVVDWSQLWIDVILLNPDVSEYEVVFPPEYFYPKIFLNQFDACLNLFDVEVTTDINQHVLLESSPLPGLSKGNRKKFRQFNEAGGVVYRNLDMDLDEVIDVLEKSRADLGVQLSMSREQIRSAFSQMPNEYSCYSAVIAESVVAAAITVELSAEVIYVLYWGDVGGSWKRTSPVVALYLAIAEDSRLRGYTVLDLGTCSVDGVVNEGLRKFKENLGATTSLRRKVRFQRPLDFA